MKDDSTNPREAGPSANTNQTEPLQDDIHAGVTTPSHLTPTLTTNTHPQNTITTSSFHPQIWPQHRKWTATILASAFSFCTMMTSTMPAPSLPTIVKDLKCPNEAIMQLMLSSYVLAYAVGPLIWAPLSEVFGRVRVLKVASTWFLIWNVACGFAGSVGMMVAARVCSGFGASAAIAISSGILSDCWKPEQRGRSLAIYTFIPLLGPAAGPVVGGVLEQHASWRWSFWSTSAFIAFLQLLALFLLPETHHETLDRRSKSVKPSFFVTDFTRLGRTLATALKRPLSLMLTQPTLQLLAAFNGISFGILYIWLSSLPTVFITQYHHSSFAASLHFLSIGVGFVIGAQTFAVSTDRLYTQRISTASCSPELRLTLLLPSIIVAALGLLCFGWGAHARAHWIIPDISLVIFSAGTQFSTQCVNAYVIDAYGSFGWAASGTAGIWVMKSIAGFAFPLFGPDLVRVLGWGRANSVLAAGLLGVGVPVTVGLKWYGASLRRMGERKLQG